MWLKFWFLLIIAATILLIFSLLWNTHKVTFTELACTFENLPPTCTDTIEIWNKGLAFFDSSVKISLDTLQSLKATLWDFWSLEFAGNELSATPSTISALRVLQTKSSGCMGLSWLAMMLAEKKHIPLSVNLLPSHVYLRYCKNSLNCINFEPNRKGYSYSDSEYRKKYKAGPWTGLELKKLSPEQFTGLAAFNMGNFYLETKPIYALKWFRMAETLFPNYPGIQVNKKIAKRAAKFKATSEQ